MPVLVPTFALLVEPDWGALGLVLAMVGAFLLGNAILFRPPRVLVEELFGVRRLRLPAIREYIFHRVQVGVGFVYLLGGFALELYGRFRPEASSVERQFPSVWVGLLAVITVVLLAAGWWWSARTFRHTVREHFVAYPPDFESDLALAREVGALFGVESHAEDTLTSYAQRLRGELGLPAPGRARDLAAPHGLGDDADADSDRL